jgi:hypothetical protein
MSHCFLSLQVFLDIVESVNLLMSQKGELHVLPRYSDAYASPSKTTVTCCNR